MTSLTKAQIASFAHDGFLAPVDVMSAAEAHSLRERLEKAERRYPGRLSDGNRNNAHYEFSFMDEIVHDRRILDAVADLVGPDLLLWSTVLFIKEPHSHAHVSYHQDATYMGLEPQVGVTAWLALTAADTINGCMRMEPGSHLGDLREHVDTFDGDNILTRGQTVHEVDAEAVVPLVLQPGQMSLHHVRTVHASGPNDSDDRRIGVAMQAFLPPHVTQTMGHDYAMRVRGSDDYGHFLSPRRPLRDNEPEGVRFRETANSRFSEILYAGAAKRREL